VSSISSSDSVNSKESDKIANDIFDWLLWIDHTLQSQLVTVGDIEEIQQSIQKYQVSYSKIASRFDTIVNASLFCFQEYFKRGEEKRAPIG
jgi:hypothetical protein